MSTFIIRPQTAEEAFARVRRTIGRLDWYRQKGYEPRLPSQDIVDTLSELWDQPDDSTAVLSVFHDWEKNEYANDKLVSKALSDIKNTESLLEECLDKLIPLKEAWEFFIPEQFHILLSRYGVGGSYQAKEGNVILMIRQDGTFVRDPAVVVMHEIVHIGIQDCIVDTYGLSHAEKEGVVDGICFSILKQLLPDYKRQKISDQTFFETAEQHALDDLPSRCYSLKK